MTEAQRLASYTNGDGPYHDEIAIAIEALMRRQIANALRIAPEVVALDTGDMKNLTATAQAAFGNAMYEQIEAIRSALREVS